MCPKFNFSGYSDILVLGFSLFINLNDSNFDSYVVEFVIFSPISQSFLALFLEFFRLL